MDRASQDKESENEQRIRDLELQVERLKAENTMLRHPPARVESENSTMPPSPLEAIADLSSDHIERYSRQLLLQDGFGVQGQCKLLSSSVLIVGAGGIGSTVLLYLAASGIGRISVVDFDEVDKSNLHRQVIHKERDVGLNKAISACRAMNDLNPSIQCIPILDALTHENALELISQHDVVVDASDNPRTRYLINDACVLANKPLVSGSAIGTEGQLTVYNHLDSPCYRCLYPKPNATEGCKSCSDNGVLGPVPGLIGLLQSLEVVKLLTGVGDTMHDRLLLYDSLQCSFMSIKKPPKAKSCPVCRSDPTIKTMQDSYDLSHVARGPNSIVDNGNRVSLHVVPSIPEDMNMSCQDYNSIRKAGKPHVLVDVRVKQQFDICSLEGAVNIPYARLAEELSQIEALSDGSRPVYCICRRGVLSVEATRLLSESMAAHPKIYSVKNIAGGVTAWQQQVDSSFPKY